MLDVNDRTRIKTRLSLLWVQVAQSVLRTRALLMPCSGVLTLGMGMLRPCSGRSRCYSRPHILTEGARKRLKYEYKLVLIKDFQELITPIR